MHPLLTAALILAAFLVLVYLIFLKAPFAPYLFALGGIALCLSLSRNERSEFLQACFKTKEYHRIRLMENASLILPFLAVLIWKGELFISLPLLTIALVLVYLPIRARFSMWIPTPFGRYPFEFTRGFRRTILLYFLAYILSYFAVHANNFNLAAILILATFLISATNFSVAEPVYYVWIYKQGPKYFLFEKVRVILLYVLLPSLPIAVALFIFFPITYWLTLIGLLVGVGYVLVFMLAKYASYPFELSISDGFVIVACIFFPPFMLIALPYFYLRSIKTLSTILHD